MFVLVPANLGRGLKFVVEIVKQCHLQTYPINQDTSSYYATSFTPICSHERGPLFLSCVETYYEFHW
jgi:hypothetical protein